MERPSRIAAYLSYAAILFSSSGLSAWGEEPFRLVEFASVEFTSVEVQRILRHFPLSMPVPDSTNRVSGKKAAARFGQALFFDPRFSPTGSISCASCHDPKRSFSDGRKLGKGVGDAARHTPALWNVAHNRWFFWDGRIDTLWGQALDPIENPVEMASSRLAVFHVVAADESYRKAYEALFGLLPGVDEAADRGRFPLQARPVPSDANHPQNRAWLAMSSEDRELINRFFANVGKAIAAYEFRLISSGSPFDRFGQGLQSGDEELLSALSPAAKRGLKLFVGKANCRSCHVGSIFSDGEFHDLGLPGPEVAIPDPGRYEGIRRLLENPFRSSGPYSDDPQGRTSMRLRYLASSPARYGEFKTPSLRNVARTAPYMHFGQFETLEEVLLFYSTLEGARSSRHHQEATLVPLSLEEGEIADLIAFLRSLTDESIDPLLTRKPSSGFLGEVE